LTDDMAAVRAKRKKKISPFNQSPYKDDYVRLIKAGWSSTSLERYAAYRYDEQIPASTFRNHMARIERAAGTDGSLAVTGKDKEKLTGTEIDVMGVRQQLIMLQIQRLAVDSSHEFQMNKLFTSTREEIKLLGQLLNEAKLDQKDYGLLAHDPEDQKAPTGAQDGQVVPRHKSFGDLLGVSDPEAVLGMVQGLARVIPMRAAGQ
jgi:hypothetical protein